MLTNLRTRIQSELDNQRISLLPAIATISVVLIARLIGSFQSLEWIAFDTFMRLRPEETTEKRILIVGINEDDIRRIKSYPIPDLNIASLLKELQTHQPAVIGLDIYRDLPVEPGHTKLKSAFKEMKNLIAVEQVLPDVSGKSVNPPPTLPENQVGFADALIDADGKQRRSLLGTSDLQDKWRLSLPLKLAQTYLEAKGIFLQNVDNDDYGMRFGSTKLVRFLPNSGSYVSTNASGTQILINFRSHPQPFDIVSLEEIQNKKVATDRIRGNVVLIGITSPSAKDFTNSSAIKSRNPGLIYGVEVQAHVVSQIISAVEDGRPFIKVWGEGWEYLWIVAWGIAGIVLGRTIRSPLKLLISVIFTSLSLIGLCYGLLIVGWWVPLVPPILILVFNSVILAAFYQYEEALRSRIQDRQLIIDQTFDTIHNGPLQTLGRILRNVEGDEEVQAQEFVSNLRQLNQELRDIYHLVRQEALIDISSFYFRQDQKVDLRQPIHEILHEVYSNVLDRDLSIFKNIKIKIVKFEPLNEQNLSLEQKRGLCRFLEEALCNVGKYALGTTRLDVICTQTDNNNIIRVADNGLGINSYPSHQGFGTKQARNLARQLRGKFQRFSNSPKGTVCELTWSATQRFF
ncbi:MAG: CHASE2 domain-containing protein [Scytonema sp. PMC 1069.18]|nr:CHASE2 domain-containing protein [Scytonema sp. PMC 1069.18]MEC4882569.1 CHASE2 domain-containing protein [Scytonema sp. PMC 1070.18]